jgi:hypothetical protein
MRNRGYEECIKEFLKDTADRILAAVRSDQLIKVMALE